MIKWVIRSPRIRTHISLGTSQEYMRHPVPSISTLSLFNPRLQSALQILFWYYRSFSDTTWLHWILFVTRDKAVCKHMFSQITRFTHVSLYVNILHILEGNLCSNKPFTGPGYLHMKTGKPDVGPVHFLQEVVSGGDQSTCYNGASLEVEGCFNDRLMS